jgi:hypothetical protein
VAVEGDRMTGTIDTDKGKIKFVKRKRSAGGWTSRRCPERGDQATGPSVFDGGRVAERPLGVVERLA